MVCGIACVARRASGEAVRRGVIVSRETHVHGDGICSRCSLEVRGIGRFYESKMPLYEVL